MEIMKRKKRLSIRLMFILAGLLFSNTISNAAAASGKVSSEFPVWLSNPTVYLIAGALVILLIVVIGLANTSASLSQVASKIKKKTAATIVFMVFSITAFSQTEPVAKTNTNVMPEWVFNPAVYILGVLFLIMGITINVLFTVNMKLIRTISPKLPEPKVESAIFQAAIEKKPGFLRRLYLRMVDSVPVAQEKDILLDHDYDGIKELDNNLPPWWIYGFYVTIIFGVFYLMIYHVTGTGKLQAEEYKEELLLAEKQKDERLKASSDNINEDNVVVLQDAALVSKGKETFEKLCSACHLTNGGGQVGPNLTDEFWLHGGGIKNIYKVITYGVQNKGMISWKSQLAPKQIQQVASYILTLQGTNPTGAKEPQGDKWIDENTVAKDSTSVRDTVLVAITDSLKK